MSFYISDNRKKINIIWVMIFLAAILFLLIEKFVRKNNKNIYYNDMITAAKTMHEALIEVKKYRHDLGIPIDKVNDPNQTGLIGVSFSEITTTNGNLEAKRTTINPNFAALLVLLLSEAGVRKGDTIAIGASSSFPALVIATLSAAKAMNLKPVIISSLGSSMWGANIPELTWLDIYYDLYNKRVFPYKINAASLGGDFDIGLELKKEGRQLLLKKIKKYQIPLIYEKDLQLNVKQRLKVYDEYSKKARISVFVNIGGASANIGANLMALDLKPGINYIHKFPPSSESGVIFEMGKRNIPVIHLLNVKGFTLKYGLPWDPIPLPQIGQGKIYHIKARKDE